MVSVLVNIAVASILQEVAVVSMGESREHINQKADKRFFSRQLQMQSLRHKGLDKMGHKSRQLKIPALRHKEVDSTTLNKIDHRMTSLTRPRPGIRPFLPSVVGCSRRTAMVLRSNFPKESIAGEQRFSVAYGSGRRAAFLGCLKWLVAASWPEFPARAQELELSDDVAKDLVINEIYKTASTQVNDYAVEASEKDLTEEEIEAIKQNLSPLLKGLLLISAVVFVLKKFVVELPLRLWESKVLYGFNSGDDTVSGDQYRFCTQETYGEITRAGVEKLAETLGLRNNPTETFYDIGSGAGRAVLHMCAGGYAHGCKGIELYQERVDFAEALKKKAVSVAKNNQLRSKLRDKVSFVQGDLREKDWSDATLIWTDNLCFPLEVNQAIAEKIVSYTNIQTAASIVELPELVGGGFEMNLVPIPQAFGVPEVYLYRRKQKLG